MDTCAHPYLRRRKRAMHGAEQNAATGRSDQNERNNVRTFQCDVTRRDVRSLRPSTGTRQVRKDGVQNAWALCHLLSTRKARADQRPPSPTYSLSNYHATRLLISATARLCSYMRSHFRSFCVVFGFISAAVASRLYYTTHALTSWADSVGVATPACLAACLAACLDACLAACLAAQSVEEVSTCSAVAS